MGQGPSSLEAPRRSREELTLELACKFKQRCFTPLEFYSIKEVFKSLADQQGSIKYLKEDKFCRFLEIPDILGASSVVFQMVSYIGAFPFLSEAPAIVELPQLIMVVAIMTGRHKRVLAGPGDRLKLLYKSLAVYDRKISEAESSTGHISTRQKSSRNSHPRPSKGPTVGEPGGGEDDSDAEVNADDDLVLSAFELLDASEAVRRGEAAEYHGAMIPSDNFRKLIMLLLLAAPLEPQQSLSQYSAKLIGSELSTLRSIAECVLASFVDVETSPGIRYGRFKSVIPVLFPHLFAGFNGLFDRFLFAKEVDFSKHATEPAETSSHVARMAQPLLINSTDIMNEHTLAQLSLFLPGSDLFHRVRLLYSGSVDGFSMESFRSKVFNWRAPTILLVSGTRMENVSDGGQESAFAASLPPNRFPPGSKLTHLTFGVYVREPWKHTHKGCFGDSETVLFQLEPIHDVFRPSTLNTDYVTLTRPPSHRSYMAFGCPHPKPTKASHIIGPFPLGSVSLLLDDTFEFGVFNHDFTSRGGAFRTSVVRQYDFQDRFQVEQLEVWGCGGDAEAKIQAERWAWEAREAEARRKIHLGTGDVETDRALLEMAGLVGANRSGGSMG